jgi:hypothetical protein
MCIQQVLRMSISCAENECVRMHFHAFSIRQAGPPTWMCLDVHVQGLG